MKRIVKTLYNKEATSHEWPLCFCFQLPVTGRRFAGKLVTGDMLFESPEAKKASRRTGTPMRKSLVCMRIRTFLMVDFHFTIFFFYGYILFLKVLAVFISN